MPELPEVETIRSQLERVTPFTIEKTEYSPVSSSILKEKYREFHPEGRTISHISRKGKLLNFHLDDDLHILSHLGMSGSWRISQTPVCEKHTHIQFKGRDRNQEHLYLAYIDPRRFGNMYFLFEKTAELHLSRLGVDISSPGFTTDYLASVFKRFPKRQLKPFLLEQKYFSGVGNYMACEICALAGIRPSRKLERITKREVIKIHQATFEVIQGQIKYQGLSFSGGYKDAFGDDGGGLNNLVVFHQKTCGMCHQIKIKKTVLAGRGTFHCPSCQK